jgi:hypothetical protein
MANAEEMDKRWERELASTPTFPIRSSTGQVCGATTILGDWLHTAPAAIVTEILSSGWKPELNKNTIYGAAIYLSRKPWSPGPGREHIVVQIDLQTNELLVAFPHAKDGGRTQDDVLLYLSEQGVTAGKSPTQGHSRQNRSIRDHFLNKGIKAILFEENGIEVLAVYDPSAIFVVQPAQCTSPAGPTPVTI